jgi:TolA-binding protein
MLKHDITEVIKVLTVKQLAEKLDVTPMTIHRNKPEDKEFTKEGNISYIDEELEKIITAKVQKNKKVYKKQPKQENTTGVVDQMQQQIDYLKSVIAEKDKQINNYTKLIDQQQQLNLRTMEQLNQPKDHSQPSEPQTTHHSTDEKVEQEKTRDEHVKTQEKGFFSRFFGK